MRSAVVPLFILFSTVLLVPSIDAAGASPELDNLVREFPTLDALENHLGAGGLPERADPSVPSVRANHTSSAPLMHPVSMRWFTAPQPANPFTSSTSPSVESNPAPLASLLAKMGSAEKEARAISKEITAQNHLPVNRYLLDRVTAYARTDYGTDITGLFVTGIGFGSVQQSLRQNYGVNYSLPLLQRFSGGTKWTRILSGWSVSSSVAVMPSLAQALQLQQFLNNLQLSWSFSLSYNISGSTLRKLQDGQYAQEAALGKALERAADTHEELLKKMALQIDAMSLQRPASDTRISSLRGIYPQFELYQARYEQAASCDERMENFFTLKGLALSLLTLAGYDHPNETENDLLKAWKGARWAGCNKSF